MIQDPLKPKTELIEIVTITAKKLTLLRLWIELFFHGLIQFLGEKLTVLSVCIKIGNQRSV